MRERIGIIRLLSSKIGQRLAHFIAICLFVRIVDVVDDIRCKKVIINDGT